MYHRTQKSEHIQLFPLPPVATRGITAKISPVAPQTTIIKETSVKLLRGHLEVQTIKSIMTHFMMNLYCTVEVFDVLLLTVLKLSVN